MSDDVATEDPKKFDLISALVGRSYPEKVVPVILDERALFLLAEAEDASAHDPANEEKSQAVEEMREALKSVTIWVRVKGVPPHIHQAIQNKVNDEFPEKPQNTVIPMKDRKREYEAVERMEELLWEACVIGMIPQEGDEFLLTPEDRSKFREMAPASAIKAVSQAIYHLQNSANVGYEQMVQDLDFLSRP